MNNNIQPETITKIISLTAAQVLMHSLEQLKGTKHYKGKLKEKGNQFLIALFNDCKDDISNIWKTDEKLSMNLNQAIEDIAKALAKSKDPTVFLIIRELLREDIDLEKVKILELKHKPKLKKS